MLVKKTKSLKWSEMKPKTFRQKMFMKKKSKTCFLDSKNLKYPICDIQNKKQQCKGLYASDYYLNLNIAKLKKKPRTKLNLTKKNSYLKLKSKSLKIKNKLKCGSKK